MVNIVISFLQPDEENLFIDMKKAGYYTISSARGCLMAGQYKKYHQKNIDKYLMVNGIKAPVTVVKAQRGEKGSDTYNSFLDGIIPENKNVREIKNTDDLIVDSAIKSIKKRPNDKPFFMFVGLNFPHPPYQIEQKYYELIDEGRLQERIPTIKDTDGKPLMGTGLRDALGVADYTEERFNEIRRVYLAMCAKVDDQLGRIIDTLKNEGIYDDTAIIVISDHGDYTTDYGLVEKCQNCFPDCLVNVPFIIKPAKNIQADKGINSNLTELTDLCATVYVLNEGESVNRIDDEQYKDIIAKMQEEILMWYMKTCDSVPTKFDDRFTNEFLENNIASAGVPLFVAKAVTGAISLTGKTPSQFIDWIRTKLKI